MRKKVTVTILSWVYSQNKQSLKEQIITQVQKQILLLPKFNSLPWPIVPCPLNRSCYLGFLNVCLTSSESLKVKVFV